MIRLVFQLRNLSQTDLSEWETKRGVKHVGNAISQLIAKLRLNCYWEKTDIRMKPDWLNDSSVTQVEVVSEGSYIRHIMVLPLTGARASSKNKP